MVRAHPARHARHCLRLHLRQRLQGLLLRRPLKEVLPLVEESLLLLAEHMDRNISLNFTGFLGNPLT